ncbi:MAG: hypothetical protein GIS02_01005 [Methanosarcinales archaeon]|uniref:Lipoprotein n=1 Tax=Candidatus Ethanoperedens thermophilum TaxID=2766897 RepID=A0A848D6W7_9EURY|nr:hypothetical protein [Candidatus Ethanoperedens thermophilum]
MKNGNIASLTAIVVIALVVMFSGCIGSKTPIHDIHENPDKYVDKEVTIKATVKGLTLSSAPSSHYHHSPDCSGFWISDIEKFEGGLSSPDDIFVAYDGNTPIKHREDFKDEWGRPIGIRTVKVKGVVRYELLRGAYSCFYIEGESWEFVD